MKKRTQKLAGLTRLYRRLHIWAAVPLFLFMFLIGITGLLLGWKKPTGLLPKSAQGTTADSRHWLPIDSLQNIAVQFASDSLHKSSEIDRIDIRPSKGIAKIVFSNHFSGIQIDCTTGKILSSKIRFSDIIENIHDGSIADKLFGDGGSIFKNTYTLLAAGSLMLLSFSGFWLWYNPRRIRQIKSGNGNSAPISVRQKA